MELEPPRADDLHPSDPDLEFELEEQGFEVLDTAGEIEPQEESAGRGGAGGGRGGAGEGRAGEGRGGARDSIGMWLVCNFSEEVVIVMVAGGV